jgi:putative spermidine/putrescine transport system permease protein
VNGARAPRRLVLHAFAILVGAFLLIPTLVVVPMSFNSSATLGIFSGEWTTRWYGDLVHDPRWREAAANSLKVAVGTTIVSVVVGTLAAWGMSRASPRWSEAVPWPRWSSPR